MIRGEADAQRNAIFGEAYGRDEEFFEFYRSLTAYQRALREGNSTMVISPNSEFFTYLKSDTAQDTPAPAVSTAPQGEEAAPAAQDGADLQAPSEDPDGDAENAADAGATEEEAPAAATFTAAPADDAATVTD